MKKGFTLIEMLVVVGIIGILVASGIGAFSHMTKAAERQRCQELVSNVATALTALFNQNGSWPRALINDGGGKDGELDETAAYPLAKGGFMTLTMSTDEGKLSGYDKFGIVTPWAMALIKAKGTSAAISHKVPGGGTIKDHILHYALDLDGDGIIESANVGGQSIDVRATAIVWACGKDGKIEPYRRGLKGDDVYSWTFGQTQRVK